MVTHPIPGGCCNSSCIFSVNQGRQYVEAGEGAMFAFYNILVGGILGYALLGETLSWQFFAGSLLILASLPITLYSGKSKHSNRVFDQEAKPNAML